MIEPVYFVGAGPGDPELLTVRAARILRSADAVIYDSLVGTELIEELPAEVELIPCGKDVLPAAIRQQAIHSMLQEHARQDKRVVRLKGGDTALFARLGEEIAYLREQGIPYEVIPGVTAASAAAASLGIPLTHRSYAAGVSFISGHRAEETSPQALSDLIDANRTIVIYMGVSTLAPQTDALRQAGFAASTPVAIVQNASLTEERCYTGTLETIAGAAEQHGLTAPALIVVGEVAALAKKEAHLEPALATASGNRDRSTGKDPETGENGTADTISPKEYE